MLALRCVPVDPQHGRFKYLFFVGDLDLVTGDQLCDARLWQVEELFVVNNVQEVLVDIATGHRFQLCARVHIRERMDAWTRKNRARKSEPQVLIMLIFTFLNRIN